MFGGVKIKRKGLPLLTCDDTVESALLFCSLEGFRSEEIYLEVVIMLARIGLIVLVKAADADREYRLEAFIFLSGQMLKENFKRGGI